MSGRQSRLRNKKSHTGPHPRSRATCKPGITPGQMARKSQPDKTVTTPAPSAKRRKVIPTRRTINVDSSISPHLGRLSVPPELSFSPQPQLDTSAIIGALSQGLRLSIVPDIVKVVKEDIMTSLQRSGILNTKDTQPTVLPTLPNVTQTLAVPSSQSVPAASLVRFSKVVLSILRTY